MKTISIGISVFNEEKNIRQLLQGLLQQELKGLTLKEIIIVSDVSTDKTESIVKSFKSKKIYLIRNKKRVGKGQNLNKIFKIATGDILIILDGDIVLGSKKVIQKMAEPIARDPAVMLVSGNPQPIDAGNFVNRAINMSFQTYDRMRYDIQKGHNVYSLKGALLAASSTLYKGLKIVEKVYAEDAFLYFSAKGLGGKFRFAPEAVVWFKNPSSIREQISQNNRYKTTPEIVAEHFGRAAGEEYRIPHAVMIKHILISAFQHPVLSGAIFAINLYARIFKLFKPEKKVVWSVNASTK